MQTHHIAHIQQVRKMLYLSGVAQRQFVFNIIKVNIHSQRFSQNAQLRTNMTVADDTQLLPRASKEPAASLFHTPRCALALASGTPRNSSSSSPITSSATERVFENGALNTGIRALPPHPDQLVCSDTETANSDQFFCGVDHVFSQMGTGSQADEVGIADGFF